MAAFRACANVLASCKAIMKNKSKPALVMITIMTAIKLLCYNCIRLQTCKTA